MKERNGEIDFSMTPDVANPSGLTVKIEEDSAANCLGKGYGTCDLECSDENVRYTTKETRRNSSDYGIDDEDYVPQRNKKGKRNFVDDGVDDENNVPQSNKKRKNNSVQRNIKSLSVEHSAATEENLCQSSRLRVQRNSPDVIENTAVVVEKPETSILNDVVESVVAETKAGKS